MAVDLKSGDRVVVPWGVSEVTGRVVQIYGPVVNLQVVVELTPESSSYVVDEPTTVTVPKSSVRRLASGTSKRTVA